MKTITAPVSLLRVENVAETPSQLTERYERRGSRGTGTTGRVLLAWQAVAKGFPFSADWGALLLLDSPSHPVFFSFSFFFLQAASQRKRAAVPRANHIYKLRLFKLLIN